MRPESTIQKVCSSPSASKRLACKFASTLSPGDTVFLQAPLGGGKTFFTRCVLQALGMHPYEFMGSPTFVLVQSYQMDTPLFQGDFHHVDLYRLSGEKQDLHAIGLFDLNVSTSIIFVEWPDLYWDSLKKYFPSHYVVQIGLHPESTKREFTFSSQGRHSRS